MVTRLEPARLGHDLRFPLVVLGIENVVGNALPFQHLGNPLRFIDGEGADEHGPSLGMQFLDLLHHGPELLLFRPVDDVG